MERGHWGHNSAYTNEQTQVPLVIIAPSLQPRVVNTMTSHLDIAPTVLRLLGNDTPPENFALGQDLFGDTIRADTLVAGWNTSALVTDQYKLSLSMQAFDFGEALVTNNLDEPVPNPAEVYQQHSSRLAKLLQEMAIF
jgi:membrane-anchored protein YejM (alkaline phosphatase superfamily)